MNTDSRYILAIAARLLDYPDESKKEELTHLFQEVNHLFQHGDVQRKVRKAILALRQLSQIEWEALYVATFDMQEKTGLYLTAHEYGDSRQRGMALVELKQSMQKSGFIPAPGELVDYIPMLYELIVATADRNDKDTDKLIKRVSLVTQRIRLFLPENHPYRPLFDLLMDEVFSPPTDEELLRLEQKREKPDLAPLPYPLPG